ncbi:PWWP domain-containing DNA repair factor 3B-like isoform X2 [Megalobrama amblycephala]|uniref:PWWP domain-containing DNA repair factor 3B-like isoform X2 n=1 Tax=Megalobrama amblycephala TaxID=75352 RepID=UPI002013CC3F|nr:PWWP domain-containing DNA repair factor 3B-like isoform X2 [Megalobrama amblycephala]XP_048059637.1 PWWP domain-containing DNA repair factor 3B-like isoform X2 [Megalobrama amblycephala]
MLMDQTTSLSVQIAYQVDHGTWNEKTGYDFLALPRQTRGNDCGVFVLMYTLSMVCGTGFQFQEMDMPIIRRWWCLLLMERFQIDGYGRRFAFWTEEARSVLEGKTLPLFRVERRTTSNVPAHVQAVQDRDRTDKRLVDFILTSKSAEQHLVDILSGKRSKWFPLKPHFQVPVYIENEQSQTILYNYMKGVLNKTQTQLTYSDEVDFICGCLLPEAIIHALGELQGLSWQEAEETFLQGPTYHSSEVEEFDRRIAREMKNHPI